MNEPHLIAYLRDTSRPITDGDRRLIADIVESMVRQLGELERMLQETDGIRKVSA